MQNYLNRYIQVSNNLEVTLIVPFRYPYHINSSTFNELFNVLLESNDPVLAW